MAERCVWTGRPASPGLARGRPVEAAERSVGAVRRAGDPAAEGAALEAALAAAIAQLARLSASMDDPEAAAILEFQMALAEDPELIRPARAAIEAGTPAPEAFAAVIAAMAADYRSSGDDYFQARAADLEDLGERVADSLHGRSAGPDSLPEGGILVADDLTPSRFLAADWSAGRGIALRAGSPTAHVAILARARGVPMAIGLGPVAAGGHDVAILDAEAGTLTLSPGPADHARHEERLIEGAGARAEEALLLERPAVTAAGEAVAVHVNVGDPAEIAGLDPALCDGIGLVRTEFLFHGRADLPGEEEQLAAYRRLIAWAGGRPVVARTLDAGGDKPVPGLTRAEDNPFLGLRGVRLSLARPDVFRMQIRALLRAAVDGPLKVMVPMVALPREMAAVRALFAAEAAALAAAGTAHRMPPIGMMVEVPAAALTVDRFDVDFLSIGSNDLTQYVMAASREAGDLGDGLDDAGAEAVLRLVAMVVEAGRARALPVSLCGDAGGDPRVLPRLLATGLRSVSVAPAAVGRTKRVIAAFGQDG